MTRRLALIAPLLAVLVLAGHASAQDAPKPAGPAKPKVEVVDEVVQKPTGPAKPKDVRVVEGVKVSSKPERVEEVVKVPPGPNVRVEFTLNDQQTGAPTTSKTVILTTSNRQWGRIRSQITSRIYGGAPLNVDARPTVTQDGRISLELTIEYSQGRNSEVEANSDKIVQVSINESLTALLENGKPLLVTQSADPISDRKVTVEVKATILN
jgi:hypothetical protein